MPTIGITGPNWERGLEDLYPATNDASLTWGDYDVDAEGEVWSGMVCTLQNGNRVALADGGTFRGLFFTERNSVLDESLGGSPPSVIVGNSLMRVKMTALDKEAGYAAGQYLTTSAAKPGVLVPDDGTATSDSTVGVVQDVESNGIIMRLFSPTV